MADDFRLSQVEILIRQKKFTEAEKILKNLLADDPNNIHFLALFAEVNLQQGKFDDARNAIDNAIALSPDNSHLFYIKARIAVQHDNYEEAERNIKQSIALDPNDADYFALLANVKLSGKYYKEALELADKALEFDAENLLALNTRSTALLKLNKSDESFHTIEGALREDPNNAFTHANYGWGLLEKGDHKKALEHFKESLKNDPTLDYAQSGMIEALKASHPVYRMFLKYAFFMSNLTSKYQWAVIIGFYVSFRVLKNVASTNEALQPYLVPLLVALAVVAFSTWVINPVSNLFLRFNSYGKFLLDKNEKMSSNFVAGSFALFLGGLLLYFVMSDKTFLTIAAFGFAMMIPFGVMFSPTKYKYALLICTLIIAVVGLAAIGITFSTGVIFNTITTVFIFGFIAFQWGANYLMIKEDNA